jgi:glycerol kinase
MEQFIQDWGYIALFLYSFGGGFLAGLAVGFWSDLNELKSRMSIERTFIPECSQDQTEKLYKGWLKAVGRTRDWAED